MSNQSDACYIELPIVEKNLFYLSKILILKFLLSFAFWAQGHSIFFFLGIIFNFLWNKIIVIIFISVLFKISYSVEHTNPEVGIRRIIFNFIQSRNKI